MMIDNKTGLEHTAHRCSKHPKQKRIAPRPSVVVFLRPLFSMAECEANKTPARGIRPPTSAGFEHLAAHRLGGTSLKRSRKMNKPKTAHSGHLHVVDQLPVNEATDRLSQASSALDGFVFLLSGYDNMAALKAGQLACLLEPIRMEVAAALDELRSVGGVTQ